MRDRRRQGMVIVMVMGVLTTPGAAIAQAPANSASSLERATEEGRNAANSVSTTGWLARGFLGGVLLGPIGMGIATGKAASSAETDAIAASDQLGTGDPDYATAWRQAYTDRLRMRRQRSALIGGAIGTGILVYALVQWVDIGGVDENDPVGGQNILVIPIRW